MLSISVDAASNLVAVRMSGMMAAEQVAGYVDELHRQIVHSRLRQYVLLIDITDCPIQSQSTMVAMGERMAKLPRATAIAIVTGSSLARLQARRLFTQSYARIVLTEREGRAWILRGTEPSDGRSQPAPPQAGINADASR